MSGTAEMPPSASPLRSVFASRFAVAGGFLIAAALLALTLAPMAEVTFKTGLLYDNDDAMRMVQVRDLMAGQGWSDLVQHRLDPPAGLLMHWSRLVDLPIAALLGALERLFAPQAAERLATIVWPALLLGLLLMGLLVTAARLFGPIPVVLAGVVVGLNPVMLFQFVPGRIDHHGLQMILTLLLAVSTAQALAGAARAAAIAGAAAAVMLAIGLETLPFVAAASIALGLGWLWTGAPLRRSAIAFGATLAAVTLALYAATVDPARWTAPTCDSLSPPWLWMFVGGGLALVALADFASRAERRTRLVLSVAAAVALAAAFALIWPSCLGGPYGTVDPVVESLWLFGVGEASPVLSLAAKDPSTFLVFVVFPLIGTLALVAATLRSPARRIDFAILFVFAFLGFAVALVQMRGAPFSATFGLFGWLWLLERALDPAPGRAAPLARTALTIAVAAAALPFGWNALGAGLRDTPPAKRSGCDIAANLAALAAEPTGLVLAPVRLGPRILVATDHSVLAAPYHRNNDGNRAALDAFAGGAATARRVAEARGAAYVAICRDDPDTLRLARDNPGSFADRLLSGRPPQWLEPIGGDGPVGAWRVRP